MQNKHSLRGSPYRRETGEISPELLRGVWFSPRAKSTSTLQFIEAASSPCPCPVTMSIRTSGSLSSDDNLGSNADVIKFFGSGFVLGGPVIVHASAVDPSHSDTIGYIVEIKGAVGTSPAGFSAINYTLQQTIQVTVTVKFSDGSQIGPSSGSVMPDGPDIIQNSPGQNLYEIDAPGPGVPIFAYFGPNPPPIQGQPPGTTVTQITFRCDLVTQAKNIATGSICGTIRWYTQYVVTGGSLSNVAATAGAK